MKNNHLSFFKKIIILIEVIACFNSCSAQENITFICFPDSTVPTKTYTWNFNIREFFYYDIQLVKNDTVLFVNQLHSNIVYLLNFNKPNYDSIVIPTISRNYTLDFLHLIDYVSDDSINIFINIRSNKSVDFRIITISKNGQIKHSLEPIVKYNKIKYYYVMPSNYKIYNEYFAFLYSENIRPDNYYDLSKRKLGIYNLKKRNLTSISLDFPEINSPHLKNLDSDYFYPFLSWLNDSVIIISFRFTNKIIKLNIFQNKYEVIKPKVFYIETDLDTVKTLEKFKGTYWKINYFPSQKIFTRVVELNYVYQKKLVEFYYNEDFHLIGIKYEPKKHYWEKFNNIYSFNSHKNKLQLLEFDSIKYDTCFLSTIDSILNEIKQKQQFILACAKNTKTEKEKLQNLVNIITTNIPHHYYQLLIISANGCPSCVEFILKLLTFNPKIFDKKPPLQILYIGDTSPYKEYFLNLQPYKSAFITDEEGNFELFFNAMNINPIILTIKNKIIDKITYFDAVEKENSQFIKELFRNNK